MVNVVITNRAVVLFPRPGRERGPRQEAQDDGE